MKRLAALLILAGLVLAIILAVILTPPAEESFSTVPEITEPGATKEPYPTAMTDPEMP